nr:retrovirus-related Pol polyprotein from transposon TNT 1-94 [Tanacetum cinerariifolium]
MLIFSRAPLFLWAEAIATACFTQNRSIIHRRFKKTPYELINGRKPDISFLHVFGALCYPIVKTLGSLVQKLFKNKHDKEQTVIRNKSRLVVKGYRQEKGIDFEESFAPPCLQVKEDSIWIKASTNGMVRRIVDVSPTESVLQRHH